MEPYLGKAAFTAAVLREHGISARKRFGQNFLIDEGVLRDIVSAAGVTKDDTVLEIGPGIGTLTQYLASAAGHVVAVEIDRSLLPVLDDTLSAWKNVTVINGDILKQDITAIAEEFNGGRPLKVVANLPYYITTPVILYLLESGAPISGMTVMIQKEVADRMGAAPGSPDYGALSLAVQYRSSFEKVRDVAPSSFVPQPSVISTVVHLDMTGERAVRVADEALMFRIIKASFAQRRKKLTNGMAGGLGISREAAEEALISCGIDPMIRGEKLSLEDFARISDALSGS